jgi:FkbM family methyltransferase
MMSLTKKVARALIPFRVYRNPLLAYREYLGLLAKGKKYLVYHRNGLAAVLRSGTSDFQVFDEMFVHDIYKRTLARIQPGDVVIDIGAQCGLFTLAVASRGARVLSFEPLEDNFNLMGENVALNGFEDRVRCFNLAVSGKSGSLDLWVCKGDTGGSTGYPTIHPQWFDGEKLKDSVERKTFRCITLQQVMDYEPSVRSYRCLKIDCEGSEYEIIQNVQDERLRRFDIIVIECHPNGSMRDLADRMKKAGFFTGIDSMTNVLFASKCT